MKFKFIVISSPGFFSDEDDKSYNYAIIGLSMSKFFICFYKN